MSSYGLTADQAAELAAWERAQAAFAFARECVRRALLKRRCDCGHWIDGGEPYRYQVWKLAGASSIDQRTDCEFCARGDLREGGRAP